MTIDQPSVISVNIDINNQFINDSMDVVSIESFNFADVLLKMYRQDKGNTPSIRLSLT